MMILSLVFFRKQAKKKRTLLLKLDIKRRGWGTNYYKFFTPNKDETEFSCKFFKGAFPLHFSERAYISLPPESPLKNHNGKPLFFD